MTKRIVLSALLALAIAPLVASAAWSTVDTRPPDEVTAYFEHGAAAAFTAMGAGSGIEPPIAGEISFGPPRTVHQFTRAYTRGDPRGTIIEPDGTWIAPAFDGEGASVGTALVWCPDGRSDPEIAAIEWDPELGRRLASAPAGPLVHVGEDDAWFTVENDELRGLDGSHVSVVAYADALAAHVAEAGKNLDPDSNQAGGAAILVPDSAIFRPRGIATAMAVVAATVLMGVLLRRRRRNPHPRMPADEEPS